MKQSLLYSLLIFFALALFCCKPDKGDKVEISEATEITDSTDSETFQVDLDASHLKWEGYKPTGTHKGTIHFVSGDIQIINEMVTGGHFTLDMNSIRVTDLEGEDKDKLEAKLKGTSEGNESHFFDVRKFPTSVFEITKTVKLEKDNNANQMIYGNLTMQGHTNQIGFKALIKPEDNKIIVSTGRFNIDRTKWGLHYKSKNFSDFKDKFINDEIGLIVYLEVKR